MFWLIYWWKSTTTCSIILHPNVFIDKPLFHGAGIQASHKDGNYSWAMRYLIICCQFRCDSPVYSYLGTLSSTSAFICTYKDLLKWILHTWWLLAFLTSTLRFRETSYKAPVRAPLPGESALTVKPNICPFIDAIALNKSLICECLSIVFTTCPVLCLLGLLIIIEIHSRAAMSRLLFSCSIISFNSTCLFA